MKGREVGRNTNALSRTRLLAFDDRLELLSDGGLQGVDVRRLFFDEVSAATVHPEIQWGTVLVSGVLGLAALLSGLALLPHVAPLGGGLALLGLAGVTGAALGVLQPARVLKVHAPGQVFTTLLPRGEHKRESVLRELQAAIDVYQNRGARVPSPPPPPAEPA